jgi:hypothetical protein
MIRWRIEKKLTMTSMSIWREVGTYDSEEAVTVALQSSQIDVDRCSITRWSSENGVVEMEIMPARRWLKRQAG